MTSRPSVDDIFFDLGSIIPPAAQRHHRDETTLRRQVTQLKLGINMSQQVRFQRSPKYTSEVQPLRAVLLCVCSTLFVHDLSSGKALYLSRKRIVCAGVRHHQQEERLLLAPSRRPGKCFVFEHQQQENILRVPAAGTPRRLCRRSAHPLSRRLENASVSGNPCFVVSLSGEAPRGTHVNARQTLRCRQNGWIAANTMALLFVSALCRWVLRSVGTAVRSWCAYHIFR